MSKKKIECSAEDKELFCNAVKDVKPIKKDQYISPSQNSKFRVCAKTITYSSSDFRFICEIMLENLSDDEWLTAGHSIHFTRGVISRNTLKQLKNGQIPIDEKLDLHGYTGDDAIKALAACLSMSVNTGKRVLLVVHGKSHVEGKKGPILKNIVYQWLKKQSEVLAIQSAHTKHGGNGAIYILVRRLRACN